MTKQVVIYVLNDVEGETIEAKAQSVIAEAFDEIGYRSPNYLSNLDMVRHLYRISWARLKNDSDQEWEVAVEGDDDDINEYEDVLHQVE